MPDHRGDARLEFDAIIIGGGAAGLMCAMTAGQRGKRVLVIEHARRVGSKILMSGGGRCNFTNTGTTPENFISANPHFAKSALARYTPADFIALVERHGIAWHEKELGQLFCDDSSKQIVRMLEDECAAADVRTTTNCTVDDVDYDGDGFRLATTLGQCGTRTLVIASGGLSIPRMGASDFGYRIARRFGHALQPTRAALVPLTLGGKHRDAWVELAGIALPVEARCNGASFRNDMLFTHRGISGPAVLQISSYWQTGDDLRLDLLPGEDAFELLGSLRRERPGIELRTVLGERWPKRFAQRWCELAGLGGPLRQYADAELRRIADAIANWPVIASGDEGYRTAEVTLGGVDTNALSSSTMQSTKMPGLYFIGEVVDVTGWLGGYNFQWAWASGHACGMAIV